MINFPAGIANGQLHIVGDEKWTYDGVKWNKVPGGSNPVQHRTTFPQNPSEGDVYINQDTAKLYAYSSTGGWIQITNVG